MHAIPVIVIQRKSEKGRNGTIQKTWAKVRKPLFPFDVSSLRFHKHLQVLLPLRAIPLSQLSTVEKVQVTQNQNNRRTNSKIYPSDHK